MNRGELIGGAKQLYVTGAHRLAARFAARSPAPDRRHRLRHWTRSLAAVHNWSALAELDVPWWTYRAIDAVEQWLAGRPAPVRVFEYGSGASTLWLGRRCAEVHSVEHDRAFGESVRAAATAYPGVRLYVVEAPPSDHPRVPSAKEGNAGREFADYVATIDEVGGEFDLIVIDGRAREAALARALPRLRADGLIVFDNTRRARYRRAIRASGLTERRLIGLTPALPYPEQTSLLTRPADRR